MTSSTAGSHGEVSAREGKVGHLYVSDQLLRVYTKGCLEGVPWGRDGAEAVSSSGEGRRGQSQATDKNI